jgi:hypothetical protein
MTKTLVDHVTVDVRVRLETTAIGRVTQTISLLLYVNSQFCTLLANLLHFLDLVTLLEVTILYIFDSALILLLQLVKLIHAHVHDILFCSRVSDHHTQIGWELGQIQASIVCTISSLHRRGL